MNNTDDSFDDIQIEGEGGAFNEDAPEAQQPEMPTDGTVDDKWFLDPELDSIPVEIMFSTTSATRPAHSLFFKPLS